MRLKTNPEKQNKTSLRRVRKGEERVLERCAVKLEANWVFPKHISPQ